ncbi:hypothetical protein [Anatilimnocola floriformis]|uniref:hypothetical protein n=1 Tax=Anatilimnocola floriformis TaxID=2948575 RepID=UPI0020C3D02C|nr:hypothetical protein [Anatilimnocola floriformis]
MYRLVSNQYSLFQLLLAPLALPAGIALLAFAAWVSASQPFGDEDTNMLVGIPCYVLSLVAILAGFTGCYFLYDAYRNGREVVFGDELTIYYPWPRGTQVVPWDKVKHIEVKLEQVAISKPVVWAPIPLGALVPGSEALLSITVRETQIENVHVYHIIHTAGHVITAIASGSELGYQLKWWFGHKTLSEIMQAFNGQITWKKNQPHLVTIHNFPFQPGMFALVHEWLSNRPGLEEIDLSGSNVRDADLQEFAGEQYRDLKKVTAHKTRVTPKYLAQLNAFLGQKSRPGVLNFG